MNAILEEVLNMGNNIPSIIHYCWFGGKEKPEFVNYCIGTWKRYHPDYEIIEWNESNFNLNYNSYVSEAYRNRKFAFVSDVARLYALENYGGIYFDTDIEILKSLEEFRGHRFFSGFECDTGVLTSLIGAEKGHPWITEMLKYYDKRKFTNEKGQLDMTTNVELFTQYAVKNGLILNGKHQELSSGVTYYPQEYFCPIDYSVRKIVLTQNSHSIHHCLGSWVGSNKKVWNYIKIRSKRIYKRILGEKVLKMTINFFKFFKRILIRKRSSFF